MCSDMRWRYLAHSRAGVDDRAACIVFHEARRAVVHNCNLDALRATANVEQSAATKALPVRSEVIPVRVAGSAGAGGAVERR